MKFTGCASSEWKLVETPNLEEIFTHVLIADNSFSLRKVKLQDHMGRHRVLHATQDCVVPYVDHIL